MDTLKTILHYLQNEDGKLITYITYRANKILKY